MLQWFLKNLWGVSGIFKSLLWVLWGPIVIKGHFRGFRGIPWVSGTYQGVSAGSRKFQECTSDFHGFSVAFHPFQ